MTIARGAAVLALALVILLAAWLLLFRGGGGTEYTLMFENAGQLVPDNDVQVGGRRVGSVKSIELTPDNQAAIEMFREFGSPEGVPAGGQARLEAKKPLSGFGHPLYRAMDPRAPLRARGPPS